MTAPALQSQAKPKSPVIGKASGASSIPARSFHGAHNHSRKDVGLGSVLQSGGVQAKVKVGSANDPAEHEADRIAQQVMRKEEPQRPKITQGDPVVRRKPAETKIEKRAIDDAPLKIQKKSTSTQMSASSAQTPDHQAQSAIRKLGPGAPLPTTERNFFEPRFGQDFSNIRIHNDAASDAAARAIDARAFAMGNQIAFARGEYNPGTQAGRTLMAHELTHTVQQGGRAGLAQGKLIRRAKSNKSSNKKDASQSEDDKDLKGDGSGSSPYKIKSDTGPDIQLILPQGDSGGTLVVPEITIPLKKEAKGSHGAYESISETGSFKYSGHLKSKSASRLWKSKSKGKVSEAISKKEEIVKQHETLAEGSEIYALKIPGGDEFIFGTASEIVRHELLRKPNWDEHGNVQDTFQVDHVHERQFGGSHEWENFWLIPGEPNRKFGEKTRKAIKKSVLDPIERFNQHDEISHHEHSPKKDDFIKPGKRNWSVKFEKIIDDTDTTVTDKESWTRGEIAALEPFDVLKFVTRKDAKDLGFGTEKKVLMTHEWGGARHELDGNKQGKELYKGFHLKNVNFEQNREIIGEVFRAQTNKYAEIPNKALTLKVLRRNDGLFHYLNMPDLRKKIRLIPLKLKGASPVKFYDGGVSPMGELFADGEVTATKLLFPNFKFPIKFRGDEIYIDAPLTSDALSFGLMNVSYTTLRIGFDNHGVKITGFAGIEVKGVGSGELEAGGSGKALMIKGLFNFDHDFLNPAELSAEYNYTNDTFEIAGDLGIKSGVLPGVKSGSVKVSVTRENIAITGSLLMGGPLNGTELTISYAPKTGITIGGENIPLTPLAAIPGITSASATVFVNYKPEEEAWHVSGSGKVVMGIAGTSGDANVEIDGLYVDISGHLQVAKGPATGSLDFNATNAPGVTPPAAEAQAKIEQAPQDYEGLSALSAAVLTPPPAVKARGPVQDKMTVWGKGEASIAFGSILTGHAGLTLSKTGGVVISGGISLPPRLSIFEKKEFDKNLLDVNLSFPIWGINIVGYKLGIFANLGTTVNFSTFIGPAEVIGANVMAIMDLDNPSAATLKGKGRLEIPAGAGLRLDLYGGVSAELVVAGAMGKVGIYGTLGAEALISNDLEIDWSLAKGLSIATDTAIAVNASLAFGISGSVDVWAPFYSDTYGPWDKEIGNIGGGLSFGANFPLNWDEQNGLNFDISKIDVAEPEIDSKALAKDAFGKVV